MLIPKRLKLEFIRILKKKMQMYVNRNNFLFQDVGMAYRPYKTTLEEDENLEFDPTVYDMFHQAPAGWPCLTFDVIEDDLGPERRKYPHTAYIVAGTQADTADQNQIMVMKWSKMHKTKKDGIDSDLESGDEESEVDDLQEGADPDEDAQFQHQAIRHPGTVNRLQIMPKMSSIVATWSDKGGQLDQGSVHVWNIQDAHKALDSSENALGGPTVRDCAPLYSFNGHLTEGFALQWSPRQFGLFISGSCGGDLAIHTPFESGWTSSVVDTNENGSSIEDIAFHRVDANLFATASADGEIRMWDLRANKVVANIEKAHNGSDVNVLQFSPHRVGQSSYHLLSGGDDGSFKVWDVRKMDNGKAPKTILFIDYHKGPVTSVAWSPFDAATLATSAADGEVCVWDISVEPDHDAMGGELEDDDDENNEFPPQLMFQHIQMDPKEIRWHPNIPCCVISTGAKGFHIFKPFNIDYDPETLNTRVN